MLEWTLTPSTAMGSKATPSMARGSLATPGHRGGGHRNPLYILYQNVCCLRVLEGYPDPFDGQGFVGHPLSVFVKNGRTRGWPSKPQDISPMIEGVSMATPGHRRGGQRTPPGIQSDKSNLKIFNQDSFE